MGTEKPETVWVAFIWAEMAGIGATREIAKRLVETDRTLSADIEVTWTDREDYSADRGWGFRVERFEVVAS